MNPQIGKKCWAIPEGYIPGGSTGDTPELTSHEAICILNATDETAHVSIQAYFTDRDPAGPYKIDVPARRTLHVRMNDLKDFEPIPVATPYASVIESSVPIVVQHTRLDSRQPALALLSTIAYVAE